MFRHTRSIGVFLWGKHVGDVIPSRTHRNTYAFIYDLAFIEGAQGRSGKWRRWGLCAYCECESAYNMV